MKADIGLRVGAILSIERESRTINFLGYGVYEGDFVADRPAPVFGLPTWEEFDKYIEEHQPDTVKRMKTDGVWPHRPPNPRIKLDHGPTVWGQECWWGPEDDIQKHIEELKEAGYTLEVVDIYTERIISS